jgi:hypothetical protein
MKTIQEYRSAYPQFNDMSDQALGDMLHSQHFSDRDKADFFQEFGVSTPDMAPVSGGMDKQGKFDYDKLSTNREWLNSARIIYENEKGEKFRDSDEELDEWMKERQADFSSDLTNIGLTAYRSKEFDPEVKKAWVKALDIFDNTGANLESFGKAVRHTITDPTLLAVIPLTMGVGAGARLIGGRSAAFVARTQFKEQLKKQLTEALVKKGMTKEAAEKAAATYAVKGAAKAITKHGVLSAARKKAAKEVGKAQALRGGLAGSAYAGIYDMGHQLTNMRVEREGMDEIDDLQFAISVAGGAALGGVLGRFIPSLSERIGRNAALRKVQVKADQAAKVQGKPLEREARGQVENKTSFSEIETMAHKMQEDLEVGGKIDLLVTTNRAKTKAAAGRSKKSDIQSAVSDAEIKDIFDSYDIDIVKGKKGKWVGRKIGHRTKGRLPTGKGRSMVEQKIAKWKRRLTADSGLGRLAGESRRLLEADTRRAEAAIQTRFGRLITAIEKDYGIKGLADLGDGELRTMDDILRGNLAARKTLLDGNKTEVVNRLDEMRNSLTEVQNKLLKSGVIKKRSDLEAKILKSMPDKDGKVDGEFYLTRQYEVFDNPNWSSIVRGQDKVMNRATEYLQAQGFQKSKYLKAIDKKVRLDETDELGQLQFDYSKATEREGRIHRAYFGEDGYIQSTLDNIININGEDDLFKLFGSQGTSSYNKRFGKILEKRKIISEEIRDLMGEYKDPFTNYMNTFMKLNQVIAAHKYESEIGELIRRGLIEGAGTAPSITGGRVTELTSRLPATKGAVRKKSAAEVASEEEGLTSPLKGLYGTKEVADAVLYGNEITRFTDSFNDNVLFRGLTQYLALQGHTRLAKTVYSPGSIARNFLGAGWMSFGAGYFRPGHIKAMAKIARGLASQSDEQINADIEKATYLGYHQSGVIGPASVKAALKDAGEVSSWTLNNPMYRGGQSFKNKAKKANMSAIKFYQAMDDVWKRFGFLNEKDNYRQVLVDRAHVARVRRQAGQEISFEDEQLLDAFRKQGGDVYDPEQDVVHTFKSGDGLTVNITRLDRLAADEVARHMQNYAGVPQYVRFMRLAPAADFLAFTTELARTMKNIWVDSAKDIVEGTKLMREGIVLPDGTLAGRRQRNVGATRLGFQIAAQGSASALAAGSVMLVGLDPEEADAIETFGQDYEKGAQWLYLGEQKDGAGRRLNMSWLNPYAGATDWLRAGMREMGKGPEVEGKVLRAIDDAILGPVYNMLGPSMIAEATLNNIMNVDSYGNKLIKDIDNWDQEAAKRFGQVWQAYEPGIIRDAENIYKSIVDRPEGQEYAAKKGKEGRKFKTSDQLTGLIGVKPQYYDIKPQMGYEIAKHKRNMGDAKKIFSNIIQDKSPTTINELTEAYSESLDKQFREARRIFDVFTRAEEAGLSKTQIRSALSKGGIFDSALDKKIVLNMINKGRFIPPSPVSGDAFRWVHYAKSEGMSPPPVKEALKELMQIYKSYLGAETGAR